MKFWSQPVRVVGRGALLTHVRNNLDDDCANGRWRAVTPFGPCSACPFPAPPAAACLAWRIPSPDVMINGRWRITKRMEECLLIERIKEQFVMTHATK